MGRSPDLGVLPLTFSFTIFILSQLLKFTRLWLSPVAPTLQTREKMNQGSISSGMRLSFSGDIFLRPWGHKEEHWNKTGTALGSLQNCVGTCHGFVSPWHIGLSGLMAYVSQSDFCSRKPDLGFGALCK